MPTMIPAGQPAPISAVTPGPAMSASKALGSDLDSSLANLVGNLGISGTTSKKGDLQWNAGERKLTGGANWQPKVAPATWSTSVPPSGPLQGSVPPASTVPPVAGAPSVGQPGTGFGMPPAGAGVPMMPQQPVMFAQPMMRPPFGAASVPGAQLSPSPTPATQSPKKPPAKDPLADLNIKDFL
ncbi:clathrin coat assembly protein AP180 isoform 1-T1 [Sarcophilus harrisii]